MRERERGKGKHSKPFLDPLQGGMAPICPTLTFERISDYTGERGRQRWARREFSTGGCGTARMIRRRYNNEKSRVKITGHREKGGDVAQRGLTRIWAFWNVPSSAWSLCLLRQWSATMTWVHGPPRCGGECKWLRLDELFNLLEYLSYTCLRRHWEYCALEDGGVHLYDDNALSDWRCNCLEMAPSEDIFENAWGCHCEFTIQPE